MRWDRLLPWLVVALLLLLAWLTAAGRLGKSRHGYAGAAGPPPRASRAATAA